MHADRAAGEKPFLAVVEAISDRQSLRIGNGRGSICRAAILTTSLARSRE